MTSRRKTVEAKAAAGAAPPAPDPELLAATISMLAETGWSGVTLEGVAERAGRARVTLWRRGITREVLLAALLDSVAEDFQRTLWPILNEEGSGRDLLQASLIGLCEVIDRHLPLVLASDTVFHQGVPGALDVNYTAPYLRFIRQARADGSLPKQGSAPDQAMLVFNTVAWTYTHMRGRHGWSAQDAQGRIVGLVMAGLTSST